LSPIIHQIKRATSPLVIITDVSGGRGIDLLLNTEAVVMTYVQDFDYSTAVQALGRATRNVNSVTEGVYVTVGEVTGTDPLVSLKNLAEQEHNDERDAVVKTLVLRKLHLYEGRVPGDVRKILSKICCTNERLFFTERNNNPAVTNWDNLKESFKK
jgi:hypothetical protein